MPPKRKRLLRPDSPLINDNPDVSSSSETGNRQLWVGSSNVDASAYPDPQQRFLEQARGVMGAMGQGRLRQQIGGDLSHGVGGSGFGDQSTLTNASPQQVLGSLGGMSNTQGLDDSSIYQSYVASSGGQLHDQQDERAGGLLYQGMGDSGFGEQPTPADVSPQQVLWLSRGVSLSDSSIYSPDAAFSLDGLRDYPHGRQAGEEVLDQGGKDSQLRNQQAITGEQFPADFFAMQGPADPYAVAPLNPVFSQRFENETMGDREFGDQPATITSGPLSADFLTELGFPSDSLDPYTTSSSPLHPAFSGGLLYQDIGDSEFDDQLDTTSRQFPENVFPDVQGPADDSPVAGRQSQQPHVENPAGPRAFRFRAAKSKERSGGGKVSYEDKSKQAFSLAPRHPETGIRDAESVSSPAPRRRAARMPRGPEAESVSSPAPRRRAARMPRGPDAESVSSPAPRRSAARMPRVSDAESVSSPAPRRRAAQFKRPLLPKPSAMEASSSSVADKHPQQPHAEIPAPYEFNILFRDLDAVIGNSEKTGYESIPAMDASRLAPRPLAPKPLGARVDEARIMLRTYDAESVSSSASRPADQGIPQLGQNTQETDQTIGLSAADENLVKTRADGWLDVVARNIVANECFTKELDKAIGALKFTKNQASELKQKFKTIIDNMGNKSLSEVNKHYRLRNKLEEAIRRRQIGYSRGIKETRQEQGPLEPRLPGWSLELAEKLVDHEGFPEKDPSRTDTYSKKERRELVSHIHTLIEKKKETADLARLIELNALEHKLAETIGRRTRKE